MGFKSVTGKLGNMRKLADWTIYPAQAGSPENERIIQCDKRIARVNLDTKKAILSTGKNGHNGFAHLHPHLGAVEVDVPDDIIKQLTAHERQVGPIVIMSGSR